MYCDIKLGNLEILLYFSTFCIVAIFIVESKKNMMPTHGKYFSAVLCRYKQVKFSLILSYPTVYSEILVTFVFPIQGIELG